MSSQRMSATATVQPGTVAPPTFMLTAPTSVAQAVVNETVDDEATRAELLAAMASTESVRDLLDASLAAKDQQLSSLQSVLQARCRRACFANAGVANRHNRCQTWQCSPPCRRPPDVGAGAACCRDIVLQSTMRQHIRFRNTTQLTVSCLKRRSL